MRRNIQFILYQFARSRFTFDEGLERAFQAYLSAVEVDLADNNLTLEDFYNAGGFLVWSCNLLVSSHRLGENVNCPAMIMFTARLREGGRRAFVLTLDSS